jgi:hypothetical protein
LFDGDAPWSGDGGPEREFHLPRPFVHGSTGRRGAHTESEGRIGAHAEQVRGLVVETQGLDGGDMIAAVPGGDPFGLVDDLGREGRRERVPQEGGNGLGVTGTERATQGVKKGEHDEGPSLFV